MSDHYDSLETRSADDRNAALLAQVKEQVAFAREHAPYYQQTLADIDPDSLNSLEDLQQLPLTRKSSLMDVQKASPPFGGLATITAPQLTQVFVSPGPIYEPGSSSADFWQFARAMYAAGFRAGDLVHNTFSYHLTPAGAMTESGAQALGCTVIPAGVGQTELQAQTIAALRPNAYVGTPSFLKIILEKGDELALDLSSLKKAFVSGEALPPSIRDGFRERGIAVQQCFATADLGVIAYESPAMEGLIIDESVHVEIVRPGTGELVADGEVGEIVVTRLNREYPLIRFATGDMSAVMEGQSPCGRTNRRIKGWMGRADQTAKVRGMFIHPGQVNTVVKRHREISKARLLIDWVNEADKLTLQCETDTAGGEDGLMESLASTFRDVCKVRADIELLQPNSLANDGKVIDDIRQY